MKIAVIGVGGIGGYLGGKLARAYAAAGEHQVYFVARGEHLSRIREKGLAVRADDGDFETRPTLATDNPKEIGKADLVLFCVKSYDFEDAARSIREIVGEGTFILPLQNGVDKRGRMERALGKGIALDGCVYMAVHIESPGVIKQAGGSRKLIFGREPQDAPGLGPLAELMSGAGINAELALDIRLPVWSKYIMICPLAAATSYYRLPAGALLADPEKRTFLEGLVSEVEQVARKKEINYPKDVLKTTMDLIAGFPYDTKTSMQRDFELGKRTELEVFPGAVVRMGMETGVETPLHRTVYQALRQK